jgi:hypothetical protein
MTALMRPGRVRDTLRAGGTAYGNGLQRPAGGGQGLSVTSFRRSTDK